MVPCCGGAGTLEDWVRLQKDCDSWEKWSELLRRDFTEEGKQGQSYRMGVAVRLPRRGAKADPQMTESAKR